MARPQVFTVETTLYHPVEGARVFPVGETDPGPMWSDNPGGDRSETSMGTMAEDLIAANDRADALGARLAAQAHDMAQAAAAATQAKDALDAAEQRAIAAEAAQKTAEDGSRTYMAERDQARADLAAAQQAVADNDESTKARIAELVAQLDAANQTIADLNGQIAKPAKAKKTDDTPPAAAADAPSAT